MSGNGLQTQGKLKCNKIFTVFVRFSSLKPDFFLHFFALKAKVKPMPRFYNIYRVP